MSMGLTSDDVTSKHGVNKSDQDAEPRRKASFAQGGKVVLLHPGRFILPTKSQQRHQGPLPL